VKIPDLPKASLLGPSSGRLFFDPYSGEADTAAGWARRYGISKDALRRYVKKHSWDDFFTFYPLVQKTCEHYSKPIRRARR